VLKEKFELMEKIEFTKAFVLYLFRRYHKNNCSSIAANLTITSLLALVPLASVIFIFLDLIPSFRELGQHFQSTLFSYFVPQSGDTINQYLNEFVDKTRNLSAIGSVMLVITSLLLMRSVESSFNTIWHARSRSSRIKTFLVYWAVLTLGPILLGTSLLITSYVKSLPLINEAIVTYHQGITFWLPFMLTSLAFALMFYVVPNKQVSFKHAMISGVITALLFELLKYFFGLFVAGFSSYQLIFGALATVPLFLIWIYLCWSLLLLGAEFCYAMEHFDLRRKYLESHPFMEIVVLLLVFIEFQIVGKPLGFDDIKQKLKLKQSLQSIRWLDLLIDELMITKGDDGNFSLLINYQGITLKQIYRLSGYQLPKVDEIAKSNLPQTIKKQIGKLVDGMEKALNNRLADGYHPESKA